MLKSSLCDYNDAYILVSGPITVAALAEDNANNNNKSIVFEYCTPFTDSISEINNTNIDNAKYIDVVMSMYNLIYYRNNYSKILGCK